MLDKRTIEAKLLADLLDRRRRRLLAGNDGGGIAGQQAEQQEREHGDDQDHRYGLQELDGDHAYLSRIFLLTAASANTLSTPTHFEIAPI